MNYYVPFALFCILLCFIFRQNNKYSNNLFIATMIIAYFFAAIRYEFGPDWFSYYDTFQELHNFGIRGYFEGQGHSEPLFISYFSIFPSYTLFLAVNSLFWFGSYTFFFKKFVNQKYYWYVLLMLFFNVNCILNNLVAMRQGMTSFLFVIAFIILERNDWTVKGRVWFFLILILCSLLHTSCLLLLPLAFLSTRTKSVFFSKWYIYVIIVLSAITIVLDRYSLIAPLAEFLIGNIEDFQRYETYLEAYQSSSTSLTALIKYTVSVVLELIPLIFLIHQGAKESNPAQIIIYKLGIIIATVSCVLGQGILARFMMILNPFYIAAIVRACSMSKKTISIVLVLLCTIFSSVYSFYHYLQADYCVSFLTYQTVFSAPFIP